MMLELQAQVILEMVQMMEDNQMTDKSDLQALKTGNLNILIMTHFEG